MRRQYFLALVALSFFVGACSNSKEFKIDGTFSNVGAAKQVYLLVLDSMGQMSPVDSTFLNEDHKFTLKTKSADPQFFQVLVGERAFFVIGENGEHVKLSADLSDSGGNYTLEGSEESEKITEFNKITSSYSKKNGELAEKYSKLITTDQEKKDDLIAEYNEKSQEIAAPFLEQTSKFIEKNKKSLTAFFAANIMMGLNHDAYENKLIAYSKEAKETFPNNHAIKSFATQMETAQKVAIGQPAPEMAAQNPEGKVINLKDFKGQYVLVDFWASWCAPCRQENPNLVATYHRFKSKNFTVLGFSLDDNRDNWLKAIDVDKLVWSQITEMRQWDSPTALSYNISAIPASFLIDPSGKIVAKNLRGDALNQFLEKTL